MKTRKISRRNFIKLAALGIGGVAFRPSLVENYFLPQPLPDFPDSPRLGRVCVGKVDLKARPDQESETVGVLYEDAVVPWLSETVGPRYLYINQRWIKTPDGYIYGAYVQPVGNYPNQPVHQLQQTDFGSGMWVEVTVPYVDITLDRELPSSPSWVKARMDEGMPLRYYYQQVYWVDQIKVGDNGAVYYRVNPNFYGGVDMLWGRAEAFRPLTRDELSPIHPEVEDKRIKVDVVHQTLSCYEGDQEVYFCRVSTGAKFDAWGNPVEKWSTPVGKLRISRKYISLQMSGGATGGGYELPGIAWSTIFATGGVAIHSTYWHNDFGVPRSHGCVNALPEHAKWIFRWSLPTVSYERGMVDVSETGESSTEVYVVEGF
jgi:lipoprotein-anchoring transpeptidase ErfK/SrfK